ncbi:MAG: DegV family protein [Dehalococcoidia bacterium]
MKHVVIVTDSASCLPQEIKDKYEIELVPLKIHNRNKTYSDIIDIAPHQVYALLRAGEVLTTSAPPPGTFLETFHRLATRAREILCLTVASTYSATFSSMQSAIETAKKQLPKIRIELVDCYTGSAAQALIALTAARTVKLGGNLNQTISKVNQVIPKAEITVALDTLKYLERSGRAPRVGAWATSLLKLKPVVINRMGHAHFLGMVRSRSQGIERMIRTMKGKVGPNSVSAIIIHSELETEARELERRLHGEFNCDGTYVTEVSAVVAVHLGPGAIGIAFLPS